MKKQILLVDDDPVILKLLNFILTEDYEVVSKPNAINAFKWLEEGNFPALIISDMLMPYLDGTTFLKNLKVSGFYRDTPVIVLSGTDNLGDYLAEHEIEADAYFQKPFNPSELKNAILRVLNTSKNNAAT